MRLKRLLLVAGMALGLSSASLAADALDPARANFGVSFGFSGGVGAGIVAGGALNNLMYLAPGVNLGARAELAMLFSNPTVGSLAVSPVATFAIANGGLYFGPTIALGFGGATPSVGFGLLTGVELDLSEAMMLYGSLALGLGNALTGAAALGLDFDISGPLSAFGEIHTTFAGNVGAFGLGVGLAYRF